MAGLLGGAHRALIRRRVYLVLVTAGLFALLGVILADAQSILGWGPAPVAATEPAAAAVSPLTSGAVMDGFGAWSPDGKQIAFMRDGQIWLMAAGGGEPKQLTGRDHAMWDAVPAWRPDGKEIAFARIVVSAANGSKEATSGAAAFLKAVDPATGKERQLGRETEPVGHVAWDPSGASLFYSTASRIMRLDLKTDKAQLLWQAHADGWDQLAGGLAVSRDGKVLIFGGGQQQGRSVAYDLWILPLTGKEKEPKRLTTAGGIMPNFDATGRRLVYRNPQQQSGIYEMDLTTHAVKPLLLDEGRALFFHPMLSPDGKGLLVSRLVLEAPGTGRSDGKFTSHLYQHNLAGSGGD
jgi:Tol biopolymer transport system component